MQEPLHKDFTQKCFNFGSRLIFLMRAQRFLTVFYDTFVLFQHLSRNVSCDSVAKGLDAL